MKRGQSLIELLIVVSVITVVLVVLVSLATRSVSLQTFSGSQAKATKLAQEQLERARAVRDRSGLAAVDCGIYGILCAINENLTPVPTLADPPYETWMTVTSPGKCPNPLPTPPKQVDAFVRWRDAGPAHLSQLSTCLTDWRE